MPNIHIHKILILDFGSQYTQLIARKIREIGVYCELFPYDVKEHFIETNSQLSKKIIKNFDYEIENFIQVCPKEMLDKLDNPITLKKTIKSVS